MNDERDPREEQLDHWRQVQLERFQRGEPFYIEDLGALAELAEHNREGLLDLIYSEVLLREERGERPTRDEYAARFPAFAESIDRQFAVHAALSGVDSESGVSVSPTVSLSQARVDLRLARLAESQPDASRESPSIPGYDLFEELGRGGMGIVYRARDQQLRRIVALKLLRERAGADPTSLARFRAEAEAVAQLHHPNIVQIFDYGECSTGPYLALEYVAGGSLEAWLKSTQPTPRVAAQLLRVVAQAVGVAHAHGIVHRDLKPANILLAPRSTVLSDAVDRERGGNEAELDVVPKLTDFGLAKQFTSEQQLTQSAALLGTGAYMAPEQAWGATSQIGPATDIHALGVLLYELLTGRTPFGDESLMKTLDRVRFEVARPPSSLAANIPGDLDAICLRCLAKKPLLRYGSIDELVGDLDRFLAGSPIIAATRAAIRPSSFKRSMAALAVSVVVLLTGLGLAGWFAKKRDVPQPVNRTTPETFAFLVGVRSYRFGSDQIDLEYTESDVDELSRVLLKQGVPRRNIRLLTQWSEADNPSLAPNAHNIRSQLTALTKLCIPGDSLLIAVTGMGGETGENGLYCYLPADAQIDAAPSLMPIGEWYDLLAECRATHKVLLFDTCQTAALPDFGFRERALPENTVALFACSRQEASYEHSQLRHGVFSYHVMRGLEGGADLNRDGEVTVAELHQFTRNGVQSFLKENMPGAKQTPALLSSLDTAQPILPKPLPPP